MPEQRGKHAFFFLPLLDFKYRLILKTAESTDTWSGKLLKLSQMRVVVRSQAY